MTSELHEAARFITSRQADPASFMAMVGTNEVGITQELQEFGTQLFVDRDEYGGIAGVAGLDYDEPLKRCFLYGPWSIDDGWRERADRLLDRVLAAAPSAARELETAFGSHNPRAALFAEENGFELVRDHFIMGFSRPPHGLEPDPGIREMADADRAAVVALHERCFENTWPSGLQLLEQLQKGDDRRIFVLFEEGRLAGYLFASVERATGEAFVDNIGVHEGFRGRGLATRLLTHGLWWMFTFDEIEGIELSVREENAAALQIYEKAGFRRLHAIRQMRKSLAGRP